MRVDRVMDELGAALEGIVGLRVFPYPPDRIVPPAAVVEWPKSITFDDAFGRGMDQMAVPVMVVVAHVDARSARDTLAPYLAGAGPSSVKAALESGAYASCSSVRVTGVPNGPELVSIAGIDYLAAIFDVEVTGTGGA